MRRMILFSFFALLAVCTANGACAQHRGGAGPGFARGGYARGGFARGSYGFSRARAVSPYGAGYAYLPDDSGYAYPAYDSGDAYPYASQPVVFIQQPPMYAQAPAPPVAQPTGHSVITEYKWPAAASASSNSALSTASASEPLAFAIVLKDGSTVSAVSVFASDDGLHYVDPDERHMRIAMLQVDRAATLKLNRARNLDLYLPAPQ